MPRNSSCCEAGRSWKREKRGRRREEEKGEGEKKEEEEEEEEKEVRGERKKRREEGKDESTCARHEHNFHEFLNLTLQLPAFSNVLPNVSDMDLLLKLAA